LFAGIYHMDKVLVSFTGRPPLLSTRFISAPLLSDINDETLLSGEDKISQAVSELDGNGWKSKGEFDGISFARARAMVSLIHADILECALSVKGQPSSHGILYYPLPKYLQQPN
jgi:hypothetical protein